MTKRKQGEFLMTGSAVVEARNVSKVFRLGSLTIEALKNVTLELQAGEFVALSGASGSGKTTLLNLIGGLDKPTSGEVIIFGTRLNDLDEESLASLRCSRVGYVFQDFNLVSTLTARENLELANELAGFLAKDSVDMINHLLEVAGVSARADSLPYQMSGGERQRVVFARAFVNSPQILLVDEPTGNIDEETKLLFISEKFQHES
jgi:putative ABC transport system ATP-binding protein